MTKLIRNNLSVFFIIGLGLCFLFPTLSLAQTETTKEVTTADGNKSTQVSQGKKVVRYQSEDGKTYWTDFGALVASSSGTIKTFEEEPFKWDKALLNFSLNVAQGISYIISRPKIEVTHWTDAAGNTFSFKVENNGDLVYEQSKDKQISKNWIGCEVLPAKLYRYRDCMFCPLFTIRVAICFFSLYCVVCVKNKLVCTDECRKQS